METPVISRRKWITTATSAASAIAAGTLITHADLETVSAQTNTNSGPSALRITDLRIAVVSPPYETDYRCLVRIDTNQGISGWGDVRGRANKNYALVLKNRILGMNPCNVAAIFYKIKQHGGHGVAGGGVSAVEMACWDLAGKAWGVPVWQMLGGKFRDRVLLYADTTSSSDPEQMAKHLAARVSQGFKFLKMDLSVGRLAGAGNITRPPTAAAAGLGAMPRSPHEFTGGQINEKGLRAIEEYCAAVRERVGWTIPIATDHYGSFNVENIIKFAQTVDKFNFAWLEDTVPWMYADDLVRIKNACKTPLLTGEDIYCAEGFRELFEKRAVSLVHPDPAECGGILESKKISDLATQYGIGTVFHNHNNPTTLFASVHAAAAAQQFVALEYHNGDHSDEFLSVVTGAPKPIINDGYVAVPDRPGLGFDYDLEALRRWVKQPGFFEPTSEWNNERSFDGLFQ